MLTPIFSLHSPFFVISRRSPDFVVLCPSKLPEKLPERASVWRGLLPPSETVLGVPGGGGEAERRKGVACGPTSSRGSRETHAGGRARAGASGPVAAPVCHQTLGTLRAWKMILSEALGHRTLE